MTNQERITQILAEFDFEKVESVMKFLNWKWADPDTDFYQPNIFQLREHASELLIEAFEKETTVSCGGFIAQKLDNDYRLCFYVEEIDKEYIEPAHPF